MHYENLPMLYISSKYLFGNNLPHYDPWYVVTRNVFDTSVRKETWQENVQNRRKHFRTTLVMQLKGTMHNYH